MRLGPARVAWHGARGRKGEHEAALRSLALTRLGAESYDSSYGTVMVLRYLRAAAARLLLGHWASYLRDVYERCSLQRRLYPQCSDRSGCHIYLLSPRRLLVDYGVTLHEHN